MYHKVPKFSDTYYLYFKHTKIQTKRFFHGVIHLNDANEIANSEDPDKTAPIAVCSGSALFAQMCLSKKFRIFMVIHLSCIMRNPVLGVFDQVRHKTSCTAVKED